MAPINGSYDGILGVIKDFVAQIVPYMFGEEQKEEPMLIAQLAGSGIGGYLLIALLISAPLALVIYPKIKKERKSI